MTDRIRLDDLTSDQLDQLYDRLDAAEAEARAWAAAESADAAAGSYAGRVEELQATLREVLTLFAPISLNGMVAFYQATDHPIHPADYDRWTNALKEPS